MKKREIWIDWMKTIGMYFIILGHLFPEHCSEFIYSFNVPLFFFLSGLLYHRETSYAEFKHKTARTLIIPYFLICLINLLIALFSDFPSNAQILKKMVFISVGLFDGCGPMWFVGSLVVIKVIAYYCTRRDIVCMVLVLSIVAPVVLDKMNVNTHGWVVTNSFLALPFFYAGVYCKKKCFNLKFNAKLSLLALVGGIILYILSQQNDCAFMYIGHYGNMLGLFFTNAFMGIFIILVFAKYIGCRMASLVKTISTESILILGFHGHFLTLYKIIATSCLMGDFHLNKYIYSLLVLIAFVPMISMTKKHCPILIGKRK